MSTLKFNTSLDFCRIRCKAYDANNVTITNFYQGNGDNFANGTKNVEPKGELDHLSQVIQAVRLLCFSIS